MSACQASLGSCFLPVGPRYLSASHWHLCSEPEASWMTKASRNAGGEVASVGWPHGAGPPVVFRFDRGSPAALDRPRVGGRSGGNGGGDVGDAGRTDPHRQGGLRAVAFQPDLRPLRDVDAAVVLPSWVAVAGEGRRASAGPSGQ